MQRLTGKVVIVAGAGGIGSGLARRYAQEGACVVLGDIDRDGVDRSVREITQGTGGTAIGVDLDGSDEDAIGAAVSLAVSRFGGLDGFHANFASFADSATQADVLGLPMSAYDEVMRVNARGSVLCARAAIPEMLKRGGGSLVFTTSGAAFAGEPVRLAYAMSKVAVHALVRNVANRFGKEGIRCNAIAPGVITHDRFESMIDADTSAKMAGRVPVGRLGRPEDIAAMSALLMSDEGSFITGQVLSVDGGNSMRQ
ncbi:NAD(P)-dependent dehydrogenase (short-subunit alcohol dehydrogenase family) [Novosphingobium chloroacetimidivorans]|uniref:NAD(P)-dependent dehydrogenase (Short-subunit alcohol dehydrogenase family) n=1 Tax=Novosphingobium chloroacetimidivorans TaxID=1428314 RepID=A0A7W7NVK1_9SPHN|nr:SDR family oxidoreductase [Novosphingobium chloroacetimidivorans]MBB4858351.1 NAD(P)-dependent dehydrogenase (short-subunit alcohol dehydrogenase family) [Novosphingobium chloroacetimidivorans]